ncbi:MAG: GTP 3',8-cyclase MoaA [Gammaproteobacteria bacterium]|nr:GTP 3',8-cyclase MoaA [Gammaproteobacteria bacterium]
MSRVVSVQSAKSLVDTLGRQIQDLRISVTDRCNFRCVYCMPKHIFGSDYPFLKRDALLTFEEIERLVSIFTQFGVKKIRLTGGEPLTRRGIIDLVGFLAKLPGVDDITMTTNGSLLNKHRACALKDAGLKRITISLDSLDDEVFQAVNDVNFGVDSVLRAIDNVAEAGLGPVKVNMVVKRGVNDQSVIPMAKYFRGTGQILRFIEYMDVGSTNDWQMQDVLTSAELVEMIHAEFPIEPMTPNYNGEVAKRWRYQDGAGEIGIISSVTQPFCRGCTRARLSAEGSLYTCLFASQGHDLRAMLRAGATDEELAGAISSIWRQRSDRYSEIRTLQTAQLPKVEMSYIGG